MKRFCCLMLVVACLIGAGVARAEANWGTLYREKMVSLQTSTPARRALALYDLDGDGVPALFELYANAPNESAPRLHDVSGGAVVTRSLSQAVASVRGVRSVSLKSRARDGSPCLVAIIRGSAEKRTVAFVASGAQGATVVFNGGLSADGASATLDGEKVSVEAYKTALQTFNRKYALSGSAPMIRTFGKNASAAVVKGVMNKLIAGAGGSKPSPATGVTLDMKQNTVIVGASFTLTATVSPVGADASLAWSTSDPSVAKVADGYVTAVGVGEAKITCKTVNGKSAACRVTVQKGNARDAVIVDISQHNSISGIDWNAIAKSVDLLILRCGVTRTYTEPIGIGSDARFEYFAKKCQAYNIPFGVYYYGKVDNAADARKEARKTWAVASGYNPLFYVYDAEEKCLTRDVIEAYVQELYGLGARKIGLYIAHHLYGTYALDTSIVDFIWIPNYSRTPSYDCDIHQYTSTGRINGFPGVVDVNKLTGSKPLKWFLT